MALFTSILRKIFLAAAFFLSPRFFYWQFSVAIRNSFLYLETIITVRNESELNFWSFMNFIITFFQSYKSFEEFWEFSFFYEIFIKRFSCLEWQKWRQMKAFIVIKIKLGNWVTQFYFHLCKLENWKMLFWYDISFKNDPVFLHGPLLVNGFKGCLDNLWNWRRMNLIHFF